MANRHCPACGTTGPVVTSRRGEDDVVECAACGLPLDASRPTTWQPIGEVLLADESDALRVAIEDLLVERRIARTVTGVRNGQELVEAFTRRLRDGRPPDLLMLDPKLPAMTGFNAAIAARAIERAFGMGAGSPGRGPTPVLFYSSLAADDTTRRIVDFVGRALHVTKEGGPNLAAMAQKLEAVLVNMLGMAEG